MQNNVFGLHYDILNLILKQSFSLSLKFNLIQ